MSYAIFHFMASLLLLAFTGASQKPEALRVPSLIFDSAPGVLQKSAFLVKDSLPGVAQGLDIYAADQPDNLSPTVRNFPSRVYVSNSESATVDVIDPGTHEVIDHFTVGRQPQHIVPSYDLKTLWVLDDEGDNLIKIDPATENKSKRRPR